MKKTIISLAVTAGLAASSVAYADATVYGILHASIDDADNGTILRSEDDGATFDTVKNTDNVNMASNTSAIGLKGSEDLGDGMKAFYKVEFQLDISERNKGLTDRDQYIGLKGGMGTVKFGTMSSNYKQMGGSVDPMYRTALEARGAMGMQSNALHAGAGRTAGRSTDTVQYSSPKMGGMQLVINTTVDGANTTATDGLGAKGESIDETIGVGFRYAAKNFTVYADYIDMEMEENDIVGDTTGELFDESATKIGGTFTAGPVKLGIQLEQTEDLLGQDYMMFSANYSIDKNNAIYFSYGQRGDVDFGDGDTISDSGSSAFAIMYDHKMSKATDVYVGYGSRDDDENAVNLAKAVSGGDIDVTDDYSVLTAGMRVRF